MSVRVHLATIETVHCVTDAAGRTGVVTNRCVELATGLNWKDPETGQWVRAHDTIEAFDGGFVARQSAYPVIWPRTLDASDSEYDSAVFIRGVMNPCQSN